MTGTDRRNDMIRRIRESDSPVSGASLAACYQVSRQVIVQDIALLRAAGYEVISTNRGYVLTGTGEVSRLLKVCHTDDQLEAELCAVVDLGGCVKNVVVQHRVYGRLEADLNIRSRRDVGRFLEDMRSGRSSPLKNITSNYHYHLITADSEETLDLIEQALKERRYW
ncbi:transcription repressor NadR [Mordavella massiliensis]|nr:transcription repressor NadR [Mordavella massiliensis]